VRVRVGEGGIGIALDGLYSRGVERACGASVLAAGLASPKHHAWLC